MSTTSAATPAQIDVSVQDGSHKPGTWAAIFLGPDKCNPVIELRLGLLELLMAAFWTFCTCASTVSVLWDCTSHCTVPLHAKEQGMHANPKATDKMDAMMSATGAMPSPSPSPSMDMDMSGGGGGGGMNMRLLMDMSGGGGMPAMCPPPTVQIVVGLVTGFAAAVGAGMTFSAMGNLKHIKSIDHATHTGGHLNMAVSLGLALRGRITAVRALVFVCAQLLGGLLGAGILRGVLGQKCMTVIFEHPGFAVGGLSSGSIMLQDAWLTGLLVLLYLWCARNSAMAQPIFVGFFYIAATMMTYPMNHMGSFNVLRDFSIHAVAPGAFRNQQWVWWVATILGALGGALADILIFEEHVWHKMCGKYGQVDASAGPASADGGMGDMAGM